MRDVKILKTYKNSHTPHAHTHGLSLYKNLFVHENVCMRESVCVFNVSLFKGALRNNRFLLTNVGCSLLAATVVIVVIVVVCLYFGNFRQ